MPASQALARLVLVSVSAAVASATASAQDLFVEDFESGLGSWTATGLWNAETSTDACGSQAPAWPVGQGGAYYGNVNCNFMGQTLVGDLTLNSPITIPSSLHGVNLCFWSYDDTECDSCGWDWRFVYVSDDGGTTWDFVGESRSYQAWEETCLDLSDYRGEDILLRFEFDAVDNVSNQFLGWLIDDVRVEVACPEPTNYCASLAGSSGVPASISATGSTSIANNDFHLSVTHAAANQMGLFFFGPAEANEPFGNGRLCVGVGSTGTFRLRPAMSTDAVGSLSRWIDLTAAPSAANIVPGEHRYFQFWFRDPAGGGFNLSDGVRVFFCP